MTAPHSKPKSPATTSHRGSFWIPGEIVSSDFGTVHKGPMYVEWEVADPATSRTPLVLVHGGGGQGTDWVTTLDGRPGWARRFVEAGHPVYVVDRVGHGRSPYHPDVLGPMGPPFPYEAAVGLFADPAKAEQQTAWPIGRAPGDPGLDHLVGAIGPLPADLGLSQQLDADRLAKLLDLVGPAVLVTSSAGGPVGWLATDRRPDAVRGIVAVEPMGPPFVEFPGIGALTWGLTAASPSFDPPAASPEALRNAPAEHQVPGWADQRILVITSETSPFSEFAPAIVDFLAQSGAHAERLHLPDVGVHGNGHALQMESNSDESAALVVDWIAKHIA